MLSQSNSLSFALDTGVGQAVATDPNQSLNFWLVIAGLLIIFFCLLTVFVPPIKEFVTKPQEISLSKLGVSMKVSILTVFVLMGFILSLSSFVLQWQGYAKQAKESAGLIAELNARLRDKDEEMLRSRKFDISILVKPESGGDILKTDDWSCEYQLELPNGEPDKSQTASLARVGEGKKLRVFLREISAGTKVYGITLIHKTDGKRWIVPTFTPFKDAEFSALREEGQS